MWWARTVAGDGKPGWVPEVYFKGGGNDESDLGLRTCDTPKPPSPPAPPTPPANPCEPTPAASGLRLQARFAGAGQVATTRYGRRPLVRGSLTSADGAPVAGAAICVGAEDRSDGPVKATGSIVTDALGRFVYKPAEGASRRVWFVHRSGGAAAAAHVDLRVRAPVSLRSTRRALQNGQSTLFRGRIGGAADARGLIVELQYPQRGRWQMFATVHAAATVASATATGSPARSAAGSIGCGRASRLSAATRSRPAGPGRCASAFTADPSGAGRDPPGQRRLG